MLDLMSEDITTADVSDAAARGKGSAERISWVPDKMVGAFVVTFILSVVAQRFSMTLSDALLSVMILEVAVGITFLAMWYRRMSRHYGELAHALGLARLPTMTYLGNGYMAGTSWTADTPTTVVVDTERTHGWAFPAPCDSLPESEGEPCPSPQS